MAAPRRPGEDDLAYWRGRMDARVDDLEQTLQRIEASHAHTLGELKIAIEQLKADMVTSNIKLAGYFKIGSVLAVLFVIVAPFLLRWAFGLK